MDALEHHPRAAAAEVVHAIRGHTDRKRTAFIRVDQDRPIHVGVKPLQNQVSHESSAYGDRERTRLRLTG
jgi:hypothetical protein